MEKEEGNEREFDWLKYVEKTFLRSGGPMEINLSSRLRKDILNDLNHFYQIKKEETSFTKERDDLNNGDYKIAAAKDTQQQQKEEEENRERVRNILNPARKEVVRNFSLLCPIVFLLLTDL